MQDLEFTVFMNNKFCFRSVIYLTGNSQMNRNFKKQAPKIKNVHNNVMSPKKLK